MKTLVPRFIAQEPGTTAVADDLIAPGIAINGAGTMLTAISSSPR